MSNYKRNAATTCGWFTALLLSALLAGCGGGGGGIAITSGIPDSSTAVLPGVAGTAGAAATDPTVGSASPSSGASNVPTSTNGPGNVVTGTLVSATFTQAMDPATINSSPAGTLLTFTLKETISGTNVPGTVAMNAANTVATFTPPVALLANTQYTATVTTAAKSAGGTAMPSPVAWSFTTAAVLTTGQAPVNLLSAGNFVILAKTAITDVPASAITGNIGLSPAAGAFIDVTCAEMTGTIFTVDATYVGSGDVTCVAPGPGANKTLVDNAILDMGTARAEAAGRTNPDATELGAGDISGLTLAPGLYKWSTDVSVNTDVTLSGGANDVWIFQISGDLTVAAGGSVPAGIKVILAGGAKASNVFWQIDGLTGATL